MSQFYEVVNGPTTVEELQQLCPNLHVDGGNIQYIINQDETANIQYQHQNHQVIGIDQHTGAAIQLTAYQHHQPLVVDNHQQQGVYVLETADHGAQAAIAVTDVQQQQEQQQLQHQVQQVQQVPAPVPAPHFHPQAQPQQQFHHHLHQQQQQVAQTYYNNMPMTRQAQGNGLTLADAAALMPQRQSMQVAVENNSTDQHAQLVAYQPTKTPARYINRLTHLLEHQQQQQQQQQQQHMLSHVQASNNSAITLPHGRKVSVEDWQCMQEHQQQMAAAAVAANQNERSGVITLTRQETDVSPMMTNVMQQHRPLQVQRQEYAGPRRNFGKARIRTQNALVTNNTIQAIASPTVDHHHHNLLQQHDNVISVGDQMANVQSQHASEDVLQQQQQQQQQQQTGSSTQILILLPDGNQQLVNLNVPQGSCSLKEILEQVGLRMDGNVIVNNSETTGEVPLEQAVVTSVKAEEMPIENQIHQQPDTKPTSEEISQENAVSSSVALGQPEQSTACLPNTGETIAIKTEEPQDIKPVIKEEPRLVPGKLAVCHFCGYTSLDFFRCQRCRRKLPENCKSIPVPDGLKKKSVKEGSISEKYFSKTSLKVDSAEVPKGRGKGRPGKRTKSKLVEEPVCLTLSSDDEENTQSDLDSTAAGERLLNNGQRLSTDGIPYTAPDPEVTSSAMGKEPIIPEEDDTGSDTGENQHSQGVRGGGRELDMDGILDGTIPGSYTLLQCRTVRIGSYKVVPKDRVLLSSVGIRIAVPAIEDESKSVTLSVNIDEIKKVLIHFGRGMPVLFFYIVATAAARVRTALNMESKLGPYYDPTSQDETQRRITLLPERLHEDNKVALKNIFGSLTNVLEELSNKEANDILVRASPKEVQNMMKKAIGVSPLKCKDEIQTILVYPPPPSKGGIPINTEDYACLGEDQFLNDVIIDFYLKYLTLSVLNEEDQSRTHVFSSFFYKRLTTRPVKSLRRSHPVEDDPKLSPAEKRHSRVKSWTKNVNIFEKDFIIIPINEHCHWFLAIICFPGLRGSVRFSDNTPIVVPSIKKIKKVVPKKNTATIEECVKGSLQIGSTTITPIKPTATITLDNCGEEGSDRDEAEADDDEMEQGTSDEEDVLSASHLETPPIEKHRLFSDPAHEEIPITPVKPTPVPRGKGSKPTREPIKQTQSRITTYQ
ncbi:uncharacterized protein LOC110838211 isoform X2 [Zootermopsis nevadensis]|uniref:uncharacterized protein LOC110838211 isoform X2 n=1 Tax=Zootermopsis nevadensis TaxID=136037 RepID=UPI000B8E5C7C|nr:uncharacterized protein LOC110838211 isoform X2 [Zootermopsis nevadensis]